MVAGRGFSILDTDIGSDVDDILALVALHRVAGSGLIGVVTVHGDTVQRARIAKYVVDALGRSDVTVVAGERTTYGGRPVGRGWKGFEGHGIPDVEQIVIDDAASGVDFLIQKAREHRGELDIYAIGALTNLARALERDPEFASNVRHLYIMGCSFTIDKAEHNIRCDPEGAAAVFASPIPKTVSGLDVTTKVWIREPDVIAIRESLGELGAILETQIRHWWEFKASIGDFIDDSGKVTANHPHDPLSILPVVRPDLFTFERGRVEIDLSDEKLGYSYFHPDPAGDALVATGVNVEEAEKLIVQSITGRR